MGRLCLCQQLQPQVVVLHTVNPPEFQSVAEHASVLIPASVAAPQSWSFTAQFHSKDVSRFYRIRGRKTQHDLLSLPGRVEWSNPLSCVFLWKLGLMKVSWTMIKLNGLKLISVNNIIYSIISSFFLNCFNFFFFFGMMGSMNLPTCWRQSRPGQSSTETDNHSLTKGSSGSLVDV